MTLHLPKGGQAKNHGLEAPRHLGPHQGLFQFDIRVNGGP